MNLGINQRIAPIVVAPQTLLTPATNEDVMDVESGGAWVNRTLQQVSWVGVDGSTPGDICNYVSVENAPSSFLIVIVGGYPPCGLSRMLQVAKKWQSMFLGLGRNTQKLDIVVDGNLPDDLDSASIFSKVIGHKLFNGSRYDL